MARYGRSIQALRVEYRRFFRRPSYRPALYCNLRSAPCRNRRPLVLAAVRQNRAFKKAVPHIKRQRKIGHFKTVPVVRRSRSTGTVANINPQAFLL